MSLYAVFFLDQRLLALGLAALPRLPVFSFQYINACKFPRFGLVKIKDRCLHPCGMDIFQVIGDLRLTDFPLLRDLGLRRAPQILRRYVTPPLCYLDITSNTHLISRFDISSPARAAAWSCVHSLNLDAGESIGHALK